MKTWPVMLGLGLSVCNPSGVRWNPLDTYPDARVYRSDKGVTSAGSAARIRAGTVSSDILVSGASNPVDGAGLFRLTSGRLLHVCGAPNGNAVNSVNTVWYSDDDGETWAVLLSNEAGTVTRFKRGHSQGYLEHAGYAYVIGGDPFSPNGEVWRSPLSGDGTTWTKISDACPTSGLSIFLYWSQGGNLYVGGGQTDVNDPATASSVVYRSTDDGVTWTSLGSAPWTGRGMLSGSVPVIDDVAYLIAGGAYDDANLTDTFYNDVWSYDGTSWAEVLANGHAQFAAVRYHTPIAYGSLLLIFNGSTSPGVEHSNVYISADLGATWTLAGSGTSADVPWDATHAAAGLAVSGRILLTHGFQSSGLFAIVPHEGALVSAWADQGSGGKNLSQGTDANKPILDLDGTSPAVILTRNQWMDLAALDDTIADEIFEIYFIGSTLNFDETADSPTTPPCTLIGNNDAGGSSVNGFGFYGGSLRYVQYSGANQNSDAGSGYADDTKRVYGVVHRPNSVKLYVDGTLVSEDTTDVSFHPGTGWKSLGAGFGGTGKGALRIFAVVILRPSTPSPDSFRSNLQTWAASWGQ